MFTYRSLFQGRRRHQGNPCTRRGNFTLMIKHEQLTRRLSQGMASRHQVEVKKLAQQAQKQAAENDRAVQRADWQAYRSGVRRLTELEPLHQVPGIALRGQDFHLDHVVSIHTAWLEGWPVERCAHVTNLQMLPGVENFRKGNNSYCSLISRQLG